MAEQVLQHLVFPAQEETEDNWELYYKETQGVVSNEELKLPQYARTTFYTYLNGFSNRKWRKYAKIDRVKLVLEITGKCELEYAGYSMPMRSPEKVFYEKKQKEDTARSVVEFLFPETEEQLLGFEIHTFEACTIHGGYYAVDVPDSQLNPVELSIATTTCKKEAFIKHNVKQLYDALLLNKNSDISEHLWIHVVDNGRTLSREDFPASEQIYYHPNKNVGGSGGFARGMIESMEQQPQATNVLMMDDDVLVIPDSIYRTYMLLRLMKEEHREDFINGAMLYYENKNFQHEDVGRVDEKSCFGPCKPRYCMTSLKGVLNNEKYFPEKDNEYGAWWYCCIPVSVIKRRGLPLPLFIRVDDVEYGLRCKPNFITMNGICVWHLGFASKYNASVDLYQEVRNKMIAKSTTGVMPDIDLMWDYTHKLRIEFMRFNYPAVELLLRAMEDYLRGPEFIKQDLGEKIMKENAQKNQVLYPLEEVTDQDVDLGLVFVDPPRNKLQRLIYGVTYNGQRFVPDRFLKKDWAAIPFNGAYTPAKMFLHKQLLVVNPDNRMAAMRTMDKKRFKELMKKSKKLMKRYKQEGDRVAAEYRSQRETLTSVAFWKQYLEI